jgi:hypothetical protein
VARAYLSVFDEVSSEPARYRDCLSGVHADGWTSRRFCIAFRASEVPRTLMLALKAPRPGFEPARLSARSATGQVYGAIVPANQEHQLRWRLPRGGRIPRFRARHHVRSREARHQHRRPHAGRPGAVVPHRQLGSGARAGSWLGRRLGCHCDRRPCVCPWLRSMVEGRGMCLHAADSAPRALPGRR